MSISSFDSFFVYNNHNNNDDGTLPPPTLHKPATAEQFSKPILLFVRDSQRRPEIGSFVSPLTQTMFRFDSDPNRSPHYPNNSLPPLRWVFDTA